MATKQHMKKEFYETQWNLQYDKLVELKLKNELRQVPRNYEQDASLDKWVYAQRNHHTKNKMRQDRKEVLDKIGFAWIGGSVNDNKWHQQYEKLLEFQRQNGHCRVPHNYEQDATLGRWVRAQRTRHTNKTTRSDRKELLDDIGFVWKADRCAAHVPGEDKKWHQQYEKLLEFQRQNGHCIVRQGYKQDASLGRWVSKQRVLLANNTLREDRKDLLNDLGFVWKVDSTAARRPPTKNNVRKVSQSDHFRLCWSEVLSFSHSPSFYAFPLLCVGL